MKKIKRKFGVVVIGSELLSGKCADQHLSHVIETLAARGQRVDWCRVVGDGKKLLVQTLRETQVNGTPVLCFGGIGATPDDRTREAAAAAFKIRLARDVEAAGLIENEFGKAAYPDRIRMADLPEDCSLIPNPVNRVPGFSLGGHHFMPGFRQMAWPMLDWVLETYYPPTGEIYEERSASVLDAHESDLIDLMEQLAKNHAAAELFSLPRMGKKKHVELGFRGSREVIDAAFKDLLAALEERALTYEVQSDQAD